MSGADVVALIVALALFAYLMLALLRPEWFEMTAAGWIEIALFLAALTALVPLLGGHMARVFRGEVFLVPSSARSSASPTACCASTRSAARTGRPTPAA